MSCGISGSISFNCLDLRKPGGLYRVAYAINKADFRIPIDVTTTGYITDLELVTYRGIYKMESNKFAHEAVWTQQQGDGGNVSYQQVVTLRLPSSTPTTDKIIEDASVSELVIITRTNAGEYQIWGAENGLAAGDGTTGGAGRQATDNTFTTLALTGTERYLPKRLLINGSDANTLAFLTAATV